MGFQKWAYAVIGMILAGVAQAGEYDDWNPVIFSSPTVIVHQHEQFEQGCKRVGGQLRGAVPAKSLRQGIGDSYAIQCLLQDGSRINVSWLAEQQYRVEVWFVGQLKRSDVRKIFESAVPCLRPGECEQAGFEVKRTEGTLRPTMVDAIVVEVKPGQNDRSQLMNGQ